LIRFTCDCGNDDPEGFDIYVSQSDLCGILTVFCKCCGDIKEDLVTCSRDSIMLKAQ